MEESEPLEVGGIIEEEGEVLEDFENDPWGAGFEDDYGSDHERELSDDGR